MVQTPKYSPKPIIPMKYTPILFGVLAMLWVMSRFMKLSTVFGGAAR